MVWNVICHICRSRMCMHVYTIIHRNTIFQMCSRKPKDPMEPKNRTISSTASSLVHQREHKHITYINLYNFNQIDVTVPVFQIAPSLHCRVVHCLPLSPSLLSTKRSSWITVSYHAGQISEYIYKIHRNAHAIYDHTRSHHERLLNLSQHRGESEAMEVPGRTNWANIWSIWSIWSI